MDDSRRRIAELDLIIRRNLERARELARQRYVCPLCSSTGCARCAWAGFLPYDQAEELAREIGLVNPTPRKENAPEPEAAELLEGETGWMTARELARTLDLSLTSLQGAIERGTALHGWLITRRRLEDHERGRYHGHVQWLYTGRRE